MAVRYTNLKKGDLLLERYEVLAFLGAGGMSKVYLVKDIKFKGKYYAVKESRMDPKWSRQLIVEAKVLGELDHPRLPRIQELFITENQKYFYIAEEFINGVTLLKLFQDAEGNLPYRNVVDFAIQICDLLRYLHDRNIVYKDLKPSNIMIDESGGVKLIDFGLARKYGLEGSEDRVQMGTVGFAAPEQFERRSTDHRTDLYSLGAMLYFLLSGGGYVHEIDRSVKKMLRKFPGKLTKCIERLVCVDPEERIQSAKEVEGILKQVRDRKFLFGLVK